MKFVWQMPMRGSAVQPARFENPLFMDLKGVGVEHGAVAAADAFHGLANFQFRPGGGPGALFQEGLLADMDRARPLGGVIDGQGVGFRLEGGDFAGKRDGVGGWCGLGSLGRRGGVLGWERAERQQAQRSDQAGGKAMGAVHGISMASERRVGLAGLAASTATEGATRDGPNGMNALIQRLSLMTAALVLLSSLFFTGCVSTGSDTGPQPVRPVGSGGRGMSPGMEAETSTGVR